MKTILFNLFACLSLVLMASCGGSSSERRIAELEDSIASLNAKTEVQPNVTPAETESKSVTNESNVNESNYEGTYEFKDKSGTVWVLEINSDETAVMYEKNDNGTKAYGSWFNFFDKYAQLSFTDLTPKVYFETGEGRMRHPALKTEWIYEGSSAAEANNPRKRLSIKKVK